MILLSLLTLLSTTSPTSHAYSWDGYNNPANMDPGNHYQYRFTSLPAAGTLDRIPWSETYWPSYKGSINVRWNTPDQDGFYYTPNSKAELLSKSIEDLKQLSPAEKYDIYMGHYDYPLYHEVQNYGDPGAADWNGICDGWTIAALQYPEPQPVTLPNPDGILVPFGSSDVKGLMSFTAAMHFDVQTGQVGVKCGRLHHCADINAGAMHVVLANQIGVQKIGFANDRFLGPEIWNQPTYAYKTEVMGSADDGVQVHTTLYYTDELDKSSWSPVVGTPQFKFATIEMDYILDLDDQGNIVGGDWIDDSDHPDFFWIPLNKLEFKDSMAGINRIYQPVPFH